MKGNCGKSNTKKKVGFFFLFKEGEETVGSKVFASYNNAGIISSRGDKLIVSLNKNFLPRGGN